MSESSLSVRQLMERYKTSKPTIHEKLKHKDMLPFVRKENNITLLDIEGLNVLNTLMAHSKVACRKVDEKKDDACNQVNGMYGNIFDNPFVNNLQKQLEMIEKERESWNQERERYLKSIEIMTQNFSEFQRLLPAPASAQVVPISAPAKTVANKKGLLYRLGIKK